MVHVVLLPRSNTTTLVAAIVTSLLYRYRNAQQTIVLYQFFNVLFVFVVTLGVTQFGYVCILHI